MTDRLSIGERLHYSRRALTTLAAFVAATGLVPAGAVKSANAQEKQQMPGNIEIQRIYKLWDDALGKKDLEASLALYADDASIESPLVQHLMKTTHGLVQGKDNLRKFITLVFQTTPPERKRFRTGFFTDGRLVTWEYPRVTPDADQMDLVEVMEIEHGLIKRHRVYWGWYALNVLNGR